MGHGHLNIWIRDSSCSLFNNKRVNLVIASCLGEHLINVLPEPELKEIFEHLQNKFPECTVTRNDLYGPPSIQIEDKEWKPTINNIPLKVPPGCYIVQVHVCGKRNEWSDKVMVIVGCEGHVCVNLIVKDLDECVHDIIIPFLREVEHLRLPKEHLKIAVNALRLAGRVPLEVIEREFDGRIQSFGDIDEVDAKEIVKQARSALGVFRDLKKEKR
jgi:hypothetical protein